MMQTIKVSKKSSHVFIRRAVIFLSIYGTGFTNWCSYYPYPDVKDERHFETNTDTQICIVCSGTLLTMLPNICMCKYLILNIHCGDEHFNLIQI